MLRVQHRDEVECWIRWQIIGPSNRSMTLVVIRPLLSPQMALMGIALIARLASHLQHAAAYLCYHQHPVTTSAIEYYASGHFQ